MNHPQKPRVCIIGAGIIGMSTAVSLSENFFDVTVITKDDPFKTNSDAAVAVWFAPDEHKPLLQKLCLQSLSKLYQLCELPGSGVSKIPVHYYFKDEHDFQTSLFARKKFNAVVKLDHCPTQKPFIKAGFHKTVLGKVPLMETSIYRTFMHHIFASQGGKIIVQAITSFLEVADEFDIVINASGWQSKFLAEDNSVYSARGQIVIIDAKKFPLRNFSSVNFKEIDAYMVYRPYSHDYVLGTTYQMHDTEKNPRSADTQKIIKKILPFFPDLSGLISEEKFISKTGIRCGRHDVRIEMEWMNNNKHTPLIHCYGHDGSGFSASWASAETVQSLCLQQSHFLT